MAARPRILFAPLDWGLGHATRCVPIIEEVLRQGGEPVLGTAGRAHAYLKAEFPALELINLPPYDIHYYRANMYWNMGVQAPKFLRAVGREHCQLQKIIRRRKIGAVISDNRFGCFSSLVPSVFITHQLNIRIPSPPLEWLVNRLNHHFIRRYDECWIPGQPGTDNLSGALSLPPESLPCRHIGRLSRLKPEEAAKEYDILVLLSGPEPQRTQLEATLIRQLKDLPLRVLLVQGKTERERCDYLTAGMEVRPYLKARGLQAAMSRASLVICRSGYSTIMDLAAMGKKALLIPTPGQTEQEYLARRMQELGYCPFQYQNELDVKRGLSEVGFYPGFPKDDVGNGLLAGAIQSLITMCEN